MELLAKPESLTSYIHASMFGNAESRLFLLAAQCFNRKLSCVTAVCKHCVSYQDYPNYKWDLIRSAKV
jgi:hypothetical protein